MRLLTVVGLVILMLPKVSAQGDGRVNIGGVNFAVVRAHQYDLATVQVFAEEAAIARVAVLTGGAVVREVESKELGVDR